MGMGETDLLALRYLLQAQRTDKSVSPKDLAAFLSISSASTSVLIDRLSKSGHVARRPHPTDGRAVIVVATVDSDDEVRSTLGAMHRRMLEVAESFEGERAEAVVEFLERMALAVGQVDEHETHDAHDTH